jgi:pantoate--beta-alanine ligase
MIESEPLARLDYIAVSNIHSLDPIDVVTSNEQALVSLAVFFGTTRLIDNIVLNGEL